MMRIAALACLVFSSTAARAENGAVAHSLPLGDIRVDGSLQDWPTDRARYPIAISHGDHLADSPEDFSATFSVGHDLERQVVYVAIEVVDDEHIVGRTHLAFDQQDACVVHFDSTHSPRGSGSVTYAASGRLRALAGIDGAWDPKVEASSWDDATCAVSRSGTTTTYEFLLRANDDLVPLKSLGFDIELFDLDDSDQADETSWLTWGRFTGKSYRAARCGDLLLLDPEVEMGTLKGSTAWPEDLVISPGYLGRVRITSVDAPEIWLQVPATEIGKLQSAFEVELPEGEYEITCPFPSWGAQLGPHVMLDRDVSVRAYVSPGRVVAARPLILTPAAEPDLYEDSGLLFRYEAESDKERLERFVEAWRRYFHIPGLSIALVKDRELVYHGTFGVKNALTEEPVTGDTLFEACSITKIVFAFAVNRMAERGEIDLDRPLHEYLPFEDIAHDARYKKITARHVLTHRTGFPNWRADNEDGRLDIKFEPGSDFGYSGEGFEYLGRVVAHLQQESRTEILRKEVLVPMGFPHHTHFTANAELAKVVAHGHESERAFVALPPTEIGVSHSMHTEAKAFSNFMIALLNRKVLSEATYDEMLRMQSPQPPLESTYGVPWPRGYGLGFSLRDTPFGQAFGHGGSNGDFHCLFEAYPEHDAGFIVFGNNERAWAFNEVLRRYLIVGSETSPVNASVRPSEKD